MAGAGDPEAFGAPGNPPSTTITITITVFAATPTLENMAEAEATTTTAIEAVVVMVVEVVTIFLPAAVPKEADADVFKSFTRSGPDSDFLVRHGIA